MYKARVFHIGKQCSSISNTVCSPISEATFGRLITSPLKQETHMFLVRGVI